MVLELSIFLFLSIYTIKIDSHIKQSLANASKPWRIVVKNTESPQIKNNLCCKNSFVKRVVCNIEPQILNMVVKPPV